MSGRVTGTNAAGFCAVAAAIALALALASPFAVAALGLAIFGALHIVVELRYVIGRFGDVLRGPFLGWLIALITGVALARASTGLIAHTDLIEVVFGCSVIALGCVYALKAWRPAALILVGVLMAVSLWNPSGYFFVFTHAHNLIPLVFVWDWSRRLATGRRTFLGVSVGWSIGIPLALLGGLATLASTNVPTWLEPLVGDGSGQLHAAAPPGVVGHAALAYLVVFAFMQTMHYVVWIGFFPTVAPEVSRAFDRRIPLLRGRRLWFLGVGVALALGVAFATDYPTGRALYSLVAAYHAYLELPLLVILFVGWKRSTPALDREPRPILPGASTN